MKDLDSFRKSVENILDTARKKAEIRETRQEEMEAEKEKMLLEFDRHADRLQETIIEPRVRVLGSLFENAVGPEVREENEYLHRIHLRFAHTERFPCTAEVTFLIFYADDPAFLDVRFEYLILPAYVTERYKQSSEIRVGMEKGPETDVVEFVESGIKAFLESYLKVENR